MQSFDDKAVPWRVTTHIMNSDGWQMVVATPPMVHQGFMTVWPPFTVVTASVAASYITL